MDASRVRSSQSVPEMRLAAPPAQPFPNTPATAKILAKSAENVENKLAGNYFTDRSYDCYAHWTVIFILNAEK